MRIRTALGTLLVSLAAAVALASPALAKGGTGGGGGGGGGGGVASAPCATIDSWTTSPQIVNGQQMVQLRVGVLDSCIDEAAVGFGALPAVDFTTTDTATGKWLSAAVYFANLGQTYFTYNFLPTDTPAPDTMTVTLTRANGQLQASRSATFADILSSVPQPAA